MCQRQALQHNRRVGWASANENRAVPKEREREEEEEEEEEEGEKKKTNEARDDSKRPIPRVAKIGRYSSQWQAELSCHNTDTWSRTCSSQHKLTTLKTKQCKAEWRGCERRLEQPVDFVPRVWCVSVTECVCM